jgi:hypothetical protein
MANKLHALVLRGEGFLNIREAAKRLGVKPKYLAMACWRSGGKRRRAQRQS